MIEKVTIERHGDGFLRVLADGEEMSRRCTVEQALTWSANLLLTDEGAHVKLERYPAALGHNEEVVALRAQVEFFDTIADVLARGIPDERKLTVIRRVVDAAMTSGQKREPEDSVPEGWRVLAEQDWAGPYEFALLVVWQNLTTGELRAAYDSGCSCPNPFAKLTMDGTALIATVDDLKPLVERAAEYEDWRWDAPDAGLAEVKTRVHRALRDGPPHTGRGHGARGARVERSTR